MSHGTRLFESIERLKANWGDELDLSDIPAGLKRCGVTTDTRVKLNTGEFGYIGITTGPKPALLLLRTRKVMGSSRVLTADDYVVAIRGERGYVPWFTFDDERPAPKPRPLIGLETTAELGTTVRVVPSPFDSAPDYVGLTGTIVAVCGHWDRTDQPTGGWRTQYRVAMHETPETMPILMNPPMGELGPLWSKCGPYSFILLDHELEAI